MLARVAVALRIERRFVEFVARSRHPEFAVRRKNRAALRELRRDDAIKHIHAAMHRFQNINRRANAHEVARQIFREKIGHEAGEFVALRMRFADGESADGESVEG